MLEGVSVLGDNFDAVALDPANLSWNGRIVIPWGKEKDGQDFYKNARTNLQYTILNKGAEEIKSEDIYLTPQEIAKPSEILITLVTYNSTQVSLTIINEFNNPPSVDFWANNYKDKDKIDSAFNDVLTDKVADPNTHKQKVIYNLSNLDYNINYDLGIRVGNSIATKEFKTMDRYTEFTPIWITLAVLSLVATITTIPLWLLIIRRK